MTEQFLKENQKIYPIHSRKNILKPNFKIIVYVTSQRPQTIFGLYENLN